MGSVSVHGLYMSNLQPQNRGGQAGRRSPMEFTGSHLATGGSCSHPGGLGSYLGGEAPEAGGRGLAPGLPLLETPIYPLSAPGPGAPGLKLPLPEVQVFNSPSSCLQPLPTPDINLGAPGRPGRTPWNESPPPTALEASPLAPFMWGHQPPSLGAAGGLVHWVLEAVPAPVCFGGCTLDPHLGAGPVPSPQVLASAVASAPRLPL